MESSLFFVEFTIDENLTRVGDKSRCTPIPTKPYQSVQRLLSPTLVSAFAGDYAARETSLSSQAHLRHDSDDKSFTSYSSLKARFEFLFFDDQSIWIDSERWIHLTLTLWVSTYGIRLPQLKARIAHPLKARRHLRMY